MRGVRICIFNQFKAHEKEEHSTLIFMFLDVFLCFVLENVLMVNSGYVFLSSSKEKKTEEKRIICIGGDFSGVLKRNSLMAVARVW